MDINFNTLNLELGPEHECSYLPGFVAQERACRVQGLDAGLYRKLMDHGWRRSGDILYKPFCPACNRCRPLRIPVGEFRPNRSQRRVLERNSDLHVELRKPYATESKFLLFRRYQVIRHGGAMCDTWGDYTRFLYTSPLKTVELETWLGERYLGSAILDADAGSLSAVYNYYEPEMPERSLGVYAILKSIELARERGDSYYYMGYVVEGCAQMEYKRVYKPYEVLGEEGEWERSE
ncbi:MAG: arginyltransferase [Candidatus Sumerlaeia bacterium]|nr:arginyltransferase [Candidatus Sumerlaeia bacterium]